MDSKGLRIRILAFSALLLSLLIAAVLLWNRSGSECWRDSGCPTGQKCMDVPPHYASGLDSLLPYKVCRIPCHDHRDCPEGYECWIVDQGPGGDPVCLEARPKKSP